MTYPAITVTSLPEARRVFEAYSKDSPQADRYVKGLVESLRYTLDNNPDYTTVDLYISGRPDSGSISWSLRRPHEPMNPALGLVNSVEQAFAFLGCPTKRS
jgi:hypothetical protein